MIFTQPRFLHVVSDIKLCWSIPTGRQSTHCSLRVPLLLWSLCCHMYLYSSLQHSMQKGFCMQCALLPCLCCLWVIIIGSLQYLRLLVGLYHSALTSLVWLAAIRTHNQYYDRWEYTIMTWVWGFYYTWVDWLLLSALGTLSLCDAIK